MRRLIAAVLFSGCVLAAPAATWAADADGAYVITRPERTLEQIEEAYAQIPPVHYAPAANRWENLPRTRGILEKGEGELRVVMLGDSIINDTSRSSWELVLQKKYPKLKITKITCVRGSTGCWWYKEDGRVKQYVLDYRPDLLIIGGISQRDDIDSIRDVVEQVRKGSECDVLLMTGAFGAVDPRDDKKWQEKIDLLGRDYRARLFRLSQELKTGFLDMSAQWGRYIRDSGKDLDFFKRDAIHANIRGEQILGRILVAFFSL